jgi:transcriptional regulator with XRE-family HTH domain
MVEQNDLDSARRLEEWIASKEWSKAEFARRMEILPQSVTKYLNGSVSIDNLAAKLIREGADIHWILTGEKVETSNNGAMLAVLKNFNITSPEQLEQFLNPENIARDAQQVYAAILRRRLKQGKK